MKKLLWAIVAVALAVFVWCLWVDFLAPAQAHADFNYKTRDAVIVGKSPQAVIAIAGKPDSTEDDGQGGVQLTYNGPSQSYCRIFFLNGVAVHVTRWEK